MPCVIMRDLCPASVSALHCDQNHASANASCEDACAAPAAVSSQTRHVLRLWLIVVNRELAPGDGTNSLPRFSALFSLASSQIPSRSFRHFEGRRESEIESWRIELRLVARPPARNQRQLFALASLSRLIARHTRSRLAPWPRCSRV